MPTAVHESEVRAGTSPAIALSRKAPLVHGSSRFYKSTRLWQEQLGDSWIVFSPDTRGLPVVVDARVRFALDAFEGGQTVECATSQLLSRADITPDHASEIIEELISRNFIRRSSDPRRYEAKDTRNSSPRSFSVWLHINNHCNLDCAYCFVDKSDAEMSDEVIDRTIDYLVNTVISRNIRSFALKFAGGEPTLSITKMETFHDRLHHALTNVECDWTTSILSNGTVMSDRLIHFLKRGNVGLSISVDGYGPQGHDIFRVFKGTTRGSWALLERNVAKALEHGISPYILATVSQESCRTLPDLVRWIFRQGLRTRLSVVRQPASLEAYSSFQDTAKRAGIENEYRTMIAALVDAFERAFQVLEDESYFIDLRNALNIAELHFDSPSFSSCCGIGSSHMVINEKGELASCPMTVHRNTVPAERDMLNAVQLTFNGHAPTDRERNEGKNCLDCTWFPVCTSGCPVNNLAVNGRPYSVSPLNPFYEYIIPRYVRFFGTKLLQAARRKGVSDFLVLSS